MSLLSFIYYEFYRPLKFQRNMEKNWNRSLARKSELRSDTQILKDFLKGRL